MDDSNNKMGLNLVSVQQDDYEIYLSLQAVNIRMSRPRLGPKVRWKYI